MMGRIKVILWDMDGTLLNFAEAERCAVRTCFEIFGLGECTDEMLSRYAAVNRKCWERLERGELSKPEALTERFREFFTEYHINTDIAPQFNAEYQIRLGDTICFEPGALEVVKSLKGRVRQCAVTNGTRMVQERKLARSGLDRLFDEVFISDIVGFEKPAKGFFDAVWEQIGAYAKDEVLIVGDSLTSDMKGGSQAGILCCWYNPKGMKNQTSVPVDFEIQRLSQVLDILELEQVTKTGIDTRE